MPYVRRDEAGRIAALLREADAEAAEFLAANDPEVARFMAVDPPPQGDPDPDFRRLDLDTVRVIEDVIDVLIDKRLILFTDLPPAAQEKILKRRSARVRSGAAPILVGSIDVL